MILEITVLTVAVSGLISTVLINKQISKLQSEIQQLKDNLEATCQHRATDYSEIQNNKGATIRRFENLEKQMRDNYFNLDKRISKLRGDKLQNEKQY